MTVSALSLAGCADYLPSFGFLHPSTEQLRIDSQPERAEVKTSQGPSCQTPCELTVPSGGDFLVTFAMDGYQTATVPVRSESPGGHLQPNPVFAELQPVAPPKPARQPPAKRKPNPSPPAQ
jgi:hypothetical protein